MTAKPRVRIRSGSSLGVVVPIKPPVSEAVALAVTNIQTLVERGLIDAIAIAAVHRDGCMSTNYVIGSNCIALMGALRHVSRRVEEVIPTHD